MRPKMNETKRAAIKVTILDCARKIVEQEGFDGISIRKVAGLAGYTPGSIYQYFDDKEALVHALIQQGYQKMMEAIAKNPDDDLNTENQIIARFLNYNKTALVMPEYYKAVMLSENSKILELTSVLSCDAASSKPGLSRLVNAIKTGMENGEFRQGNPETIAKLLWTANFGLLVRFMIENITDDQLIEALTREQFQLLFNGIKKN